MSLQLFTNPGLLGQVHRNVLTRLLEDFKDSLPPQAAALLCSHLDHEPFCAAWAAQFQSPQAFGPPLLRALVEIETLALPENAPLLEEALTHLPPGYEVSTTLPSLHQALHFWLIAHHTAGVTWPLKCQVCECDVCSAESGTISASPATGGRRARAPALQVAQSGTISAPPATATPESAPNSALCNPQFGSPPQPQAQDAAPQPSSTALEASTSETSETSIALSPNPAAQSAIEPDIARLANLSPAQYDRLRRAEAKRLGLRLRTLDDQVERARSLEDEAAANALILPQLEPWPEPIRDAPALFDEVHDRFTRYLYLPAGAPVVLALWAGHAHAIKAFTHTPRLHFTSGEPGCGKSTALQLLAAMTPRALRTDNLKTAVLFRVVHHHQPTLYLDELDTYLHLYPELRGLLNAGTTDGACVFRCEGHIVRAFKAFAATALAGIGPLATTLRDRSIVFALTKAPPGALQARFDQRKLETETVLGRKMARWAQDNFDAIAACDPLLPPNAHNRLADNWRPLFALAQTIGGHWPQRVLEAFNQVTVRPGPAADFGLALLADIRHVFAQSGAERLFSSALVGSLCVLPGRPWSEAKTENGCVRPIDERWLARHLRRFGVRSRTLRIGGERAKGYEFADFTQAFAKFLNGKS